MADLYHNVVTQQVLNPAVSNTTKTSSTIDLQGFYSSTVVFSVGQSGDTLSGSVFWTLKIQHSDDDSTYVDVPLSGLLNAAQTVVVDSSTKDRAAYGFGYIGGKRYVKAVATPTGTHTVGTPIGVIALKGDASISPVI
jgi:hypothetical protein